MGYEGTTVVDPRTVRVDFSAPSAQFLQASSTFSLGLLSPASAALSVEDRCAGKFVGSGPFAVRSYTFDQEVVLGKGAGYDWASGADDHTGEAYLDTVTVKFVPEASVRTGSLLSGQIDATAAISTVDLPQFVMKHRTKLVLKPNDATAEVPPVRGMDVDDLTWERSLRQAMRTPARRWKAA